MKRVVIFASGSGTNAENLIRFFQNRDNVSVIQVLTNNPHAKVLDRCKKLKTSALSFNRTTLYNTDDVLNMLKNNSPDLIVLAGFLWKFPDNILNAFPNKVINIHPALLPNYGGKGMYGMHIHEAVVANKETETGITIHYVNENYDEGAVIFQAKCDVNSSDSAEDVASKIHELEMTHFPEVVERLLSSQQLENKSSINRIYTNKEIQQKIFNVLKNLTEPELNRYCDKNNSKIAFNNNFPLLIKVSKNISSVEKRESIIHKNVNRWTWKFQIDKGNYIYALSTQWYEWNDKHVRDWLMKNKA